MHFARTPARCRRRSWARSIAAACSTGGRMCVQRGRCTRRSVLKYEQHPFATFENELHKPKHGRYIGELYSSASVAKQYLLLLGIKPLLVKQPLFSRKYLGIAMAATSAAVPTCADASLTGRCACWTSHRCTRRFFACRSSRSCSSPRGSERRGLPPKSGALFNSSNARFHVRPFRSEALAPV